MARRRRHRRVGVGVGVGVGTSSTSTSSTNTSSTSTRPRLRPRHFVDAFPGTGGGDGGHLGTMARASRVDDARLVRRSFRFPRRPLVARRFRIADSFEDARAFASWVSGDEREGTVDRPDATSQLAILSDAFARARRKYWRDAVGSADAVAGGGILDDADMEQTEEGEEGGGALEHESEDEPSRGTRNVTRRRSVAGGRAAEWGGPLLLRLDVRGDARRTVPEGPAGVRGGDGATVRARVARGVHRPRRIGASGRHRARRRPRRRRASRGGDRRRGTSRFTDRFGRTPRVDDFSISFTISFTISVCVTLRCFRATPRARVLARGGAVIARGRRVDPSAVGAPAPGRRVPHARRAPRRGVRRRRTMRRPSDSSTRRRRIRARRVAHRDDPSSSLATPARVARGRRVRIALGDVAVRRDAARAPSTRDASARVRKSVFENRGSAVRRVRRRAEGPRGVSRVR